MIGQSKENRSICVFDVDVSWKTATSWVKRLDTTNKIIVLGSVFQYGYGLGVMNQLGGDLEQIFNEQGTVMTMNFTSGWSWVLVRDFIRWKSILRW